MADEKKNVANEVASDDAKSEKRQKKRSLLSSHPKR